MLSYRDPRQLEKYGFVSFSRKLYAPAYNPVTDQEENSDITFPDFIQLVIEGPIELSKFLEENQVISLKLY